jgi:hypothetical protein
MVDDRVGYGRPPKHTQFKKGDRVNPKGRPKRGPSAAFDAIARILNDTVEYREGGKTKRSTRRELTIRTHVNLALNGNVKSADLLLKLYAHVQKHGEAAVQTILIADWLPDHPGQTAAQKTKEFALKHRADVPGWWAKAPAEKKL